MNRIIPGAIINTVSNVPPVTQIGNRGTTTAVLPLNWGVEDDFIEVFATDLLDGRSLAKVGFTGFDPESFELSLLLANCPRALIYRGDSGGTKAHAILIEEDDDSIVVEAKYSGTLGNHIKVSIIDNNGENFEVSTFVNSRRRDRQFIKKASEFVPNDFITMQIIGEELDLEEIAGEPLHDGTNGEFVESEAYAEFFDKARRIRWNTMAVSTLDADIKKTAIKYAKDLRENQKRVQVVIPRVMADTVAVISVNQAFKISNRLVEPYKFAFWVAGSIAGASINESLTGRTVNGATVLIDDLDKRYLENNILHGMMSLSVKQNGSVMITQDINTLTTFTREQSREFRKNRIIRILDEIADTLTDMWEENYMGIVDNNESGRMLLQAEVAGYMYRLQDLGAVQEFDATQHLQVAQGESLDSVRMKLSVKPVDSMEFLDVDIEVTA